MKDGFFESLSELVKALEDGLSIRHCSWNSDQHAHAVKSSKSTLCFYDQNGNNVCICLENVTPNNWSIYMPPKKKIKLAPAAYCGCNGQWSITNSLYSSLADAHRNLTTDKVIWPANEHSYVEIEVEYEQSKK